MEKTDATYEGAQGRLPLWLSVEDLQWLAGHCCCTDSSSAEERERCGRLRFRASAALHKAGVGESGRVKCGNSINFRQALTYGRVYDVLEQDIEKRQYRVKGDNGRKRWYPAYCFVSVGFPTPRLLSFEVDERNRDEVTVTLDDGTRRWLSFVSLPHLSDILHSNGYYRDQATVFVETLETAELERILQDLQDSGRLVDSTRPLV